MAEDVENFIRERAQRLQNVAADVKDQVYLREIMDELTRLRFEIAGMRQAIGKMTGQ